MKNNYSISGGALYFSLQMSVFILFILSAFVGWVYLHRQMGSAAVEKIEAQQAARSLIYDHLGRANKTTKSALISFPYGLFDVLLTKKEEVPTVAMIGPVAYDPKTVMYLPDQGQNLYVGKTVDIEGDLYTAKAGMRSTHLGKWHRQNPSPKRNYNLKISQDQLPQLSANVTERIAHLLNPQRWTQSAFPYDQKSFKNSFYAPLHIIEINRPTRLENIELAGHIWLRSTAPITIAASAKLHDILLTAPQLYFEGGVNGQLQAFASQKLHLGKNSQFHYPSVLWLADQSAFQSTASPPFFIGSDTLVEGIIGYTKKDKDPPKGVALSLGTKSSVYGQIYCSGILSTSATIVGSVFTQELGVLYQGVLYKHHLLYGGLSPDLKHSTSGGLPFALSTKKKILQWLY